MPLDGHSYLIAQGWGGKGTGLREDSISRPLAVAQKKNLAGVGNDRDEAYPFWDHLFSAAAKSIHIKVMTDEDEDIDDDVKKDKVQKKASTPESTITFKLTETGILSNRRPVATSGTNVPDTITSSNYNLLTTAKREAARSGLYSRFLRGPLLCPNSLFEKAVKSKDVAIPHDSPQPEPSQAQDSSENVLESFKCEKDKGSKKSKKRGHDVDVSLKEDKRERKRRKEARRTQASKEANPMVDDEDGERCELKRKRKEAKAAATRAIGYTKAVSSSENLTKKEKKKKQKQKTLEGTDDRTALESEDACRTEASKYYRN